MSADHVLLRTINRDQMVFRTVDVERLIEADHPARLMWEAVGQLDLGPFYEAIGSNTTQGGRPTYAPQLLISVWAYAYSRGIGSAREIDRRCGYEPAFQWLTGMEGVNYHTLADFRVAKHEELDKLFSYLLGGLSAAGLVSLEQVTVDGTKIKANASGKTFRREKTLQEHLKKAQEQVEALSDPHAEEGQSVRQQKARERACREKQERLKLALEQMKELQEQKRGTEEKEGVRVSMTDPEARRMKQADGGCAPNYNAQICTDGAQGIIVDVKVTQAGNDFQQLLPALDRIEERLRTPKQMMGDGGYTDRENVEKMAGRGVDFIGSLADRASQSKGQDRFPSNLFVYDEGQNIFVCPAGKTLKYEGQQGKDGQRVYKYKAQKQDCQNCPLKMQCCPNNEKHGRSVVRSEETVAMVAFRAKMATEEAQAQYRRRAQIAEFPNAWIKTKLGLRQFHVRGLIKVQAELLWAGLTFNLQKWIGFLRQKALPVTVTMG